MVSLTAGNTTDSMGALTINAGGLMRADANATNLNGGINLNGGELGASLAGTPPGATT